MDKTERRELSVCLKRLIVFMWFLSQTHFHLRYNFETYKIRI